MREFDPAILKKLYIPPPTSHKGQNGKLLLIGGSHLFHAASLWSLEVASKIVDMVFYASVPENNEIVQKAREQFRNGIVIRREDLESYVKEADCILIGPGMVRDYKLKEHLSSIKIDDIVFINNIKNEGEQSFLLTSYLLRHYPEKKYVIDAGALQMMDPKWLKHIKGLPIVTPHHAEFEQVFGIELATEDPYKLELILSSVAKEYGCVILLKGQFDVACSPTECALIPGGNAGMTKGGTGDVLAGLVASLYCKNDSLLSASCASYINKKAGERLFTDTGYYFNSSDLINVIPKVMKELIL